MDSIRDRAQNRQLRECPSDQLRAMPTALKLERGLAAPHFAAKPRQGRTPPPESRPTGTARLARTPPASGRADFVCRHLEGLQDFVLIHDLERGALIRLLLGCLVLGNSLRNRQVSHIGPLMIKNN